MSNPLREFGVDFTKFFKRPGKPELLKQLKAFDCTEYSCNDPCPMFAFGLHADEYMGAELPCMINYVVLRDTRMKVIHTSKICNTASPGKVNVGLVYLRLLELMARLDGGER